MHLHMYMGCCRITRMSLAADPLSFLYALSCLDVHILHMAKQDIEFFSFILHLQLDKVSGTGISTTRTHIPKVSSICRTARGCLIYLRITGSVDRCTIGAIQIDTIMEVTDRWSIPIPTGERVALQWRDQGTVPADKIQCVIVGHHLIGIRRISIDAPSGLSLHDIGKFLCCFQCPSSTFFTIDPFDESISEIISA